MDKAHEEKRRPRQQSKVKWYKKKFAYRFTTGIWGDTSYLNGVIDQQLIDQIVWLTGLWAQHSHFRQDSHTNGLQNVGL